jgi:hypothetical protein
VSGNERRKPIHALKESSRASLPKTAARSCTGLILETVAQRRDGIHDFFTIGFMGYVVSMFEDG